MSDKDRAKKLAAAKKKLKEYHQQKGKQQSGIEDYDNGVYQNECKIDSKSESERSEENEKGSILFSSNEKLDNVKGLDGPKRPPKNAGVQNGNESSIHLEAIELLIGEKASLSTQVSKLQTSCKKKDLEIEELNTMLESAKRRIESLEKTSIEQNSEISNLRAGLEAIQTKLGSQEGDAQKYKRQYEEQSEYIEELKHELALGRKKSDEIEAELKDKSCQLELYKIRINQISEETNVATDNRVEDLTQAKFSNEQQIRDLEGIVKQLNSEKEQASQQYQNYVQHLNKEVSSLAEKNLELANERSKLMDREKTMIDHIAKLEKQIQDNIARQESLRGNENEHGNSQLKEENLARKQKLDELEKQFAELNSKIHLHENTIADLTFKIEEKDAKIEEMEKQCEKIRSEQPDSTKLLATIESDKVAASRAVAQNEELKKQLEEIQLKLIQVTNEKVELVDLLHSERHSNKEVRANYEQMNDNLKQITEKLHFKDEEMIRLTHENNELNKKILQLNQQIDRLTHYEANEYINKYVDKTESNNNVNHLHNECSHNENDQCDHNDEVDHIVTENAAEALPVEDISYDTVKASNCERNIHSQMSSALPTTEAMEKLQDRFKTLMSEVADLTDEKQRLEHLVLQLQGETETIGEYIALYQTQRRVLKQKEIEKNTQLHRLLTEREEMKEKIVELTQLVNNVVVKAENPKKEVIQEKIHSIMSAINDIEGVQERPAVCVDHCACCSGKFETI